MFCLEYSLIWTICHKLMWFYRNTVLFHIIFVVTHGEIFGHLGHTGPLTVKTKWRCHRCIGGDCVVFLLLLKEIRLQLSHKASQQVLLQHVSHTTETDKVSLVLWSTVSQNLRPLGAARTMWVYFALILETRRYTHYRSTYCLGLWGADVTVWDCDPASREFWSFARKRVITGEPLNSAPDWREITGVDCNYLTS